MSKYSRDLSQHIPEDEPFFVIRGKDSLAVAAITSYAQLLRTAALGVESLYEDSEMAASLYDLAREVDNHAAQVVAWQSANAGKVRLPD